MNYFLIQENSYACRYWLRRYYLDVCIVYFLDVIECYQWKFKLSQPKRPDWCRLFKIHPAVRGVRRFKTVWFRVGREDKTFILRNFTFWKFYFIMALRDEDKYNIPELIYDVGTNVTYRKGRFFGKVSLSLSVSSWLLCTDFI